MLIIGGGPSGISCANVLGKNKISTLLVDKKVKEKIGDKVCGDALNPYFTKIANENWDLPEPKFDENISAIIIEGPRNRANLGTTTATVNRLQYGQRLLKMAETYSTVKILANYSFSTILKHSPNFFIVEIQNNEHKEKIRCKILIDASGSSAVVRKNIAKQVDDNITSDYLHRNYMIAYREIIQTRQPHTYQKGMYIMFPPELEELMPAYYWIFSKGERMVNIGLGYPNDKHHKGKSIKELNKNIRDRFFHDFDVLDGRSDRIPFGLPLKSLVHDNFISVGDAGSLVNPLNGEGHAPAIFSGIYAAETVIRAIQSGDYSKQSLWEYNKRIWREYGVLHSEAIHTLPILEKYGIRSFDWLIKKEILSKDILVFDKDKSNSKISLLSVLKLMQRPFLFLSLIRMKIKTSRLQKHCKDYPDIAGFSRWSQKLDKLIQT